VTTRLRLRLPGVCLCANAFGVAAPHLHLSVLHATHLHLCLSPHLSPAVAMSICSPIYHHHHHHHHHHQLTIDRILVVAVVDDTPFVRTCGRSRHGTLTAPAHPALAGVCITIMPRGTAAARVRHIAARATCAAQLFFLLARADRAWRCAMKSFRGAALLSYE